MFALTKGMGPDNDRPLNRDFVEIVEVPPNYRADLTFGSDADWENALCIYDESGSKQVEKRPKSGPGGMTPESLLNNEGVETKHYYFTGWHKRPSKDLWEQSWCWRTGGPGTFRIGFEDGGQDAGETLDYNDVYVEVTMVRI
jgi:hypothetical protein